jgi:hypothetical protein
MVRWLIDVGSYIILTAVSFAFLVSLMILQCQPLVLVVQLIGGTIMRVTSSEHFILGGIIGSVFITEIRQNDSGVLNMSRLNDYLVGLLSGNLVGQFLPCLYCDGIFANHTTILPRFTNPTPEERLLNLKLASQRQCIEHVFGDHRGSALIFFQFLTTFVYSTKVSRCAGNVYYHFVC